ncbi:hypothetical protein BPJM79_20120 [Bacillus pumilus]
MTLPEVESFANPGCKEKGSVEIFTFSVVLASPELLVLSPDLFPLKPQALNTSVKISIKVTTDQRFFNCIPPYNMF